MRKTPKQRFKVGDKVYDRWYPFVNGTIVEVLKTRVKVDFGDPEEIITFDRDHIKFLNLKCAKHPKYKALRKPRKCKTCWRIYEM